MLKRGLFKRRVGENAALESEKEEATHPAHVASQTKGKRELGMREIWGRDRRSVLLQLRILLF